MILVDKATQLIQQLGFTNYEARAYVSLLSCQPASAYEVAKQSGMPSSKIYETLNKLVAKGIVQPTSEAGQGQHYVALNATDFSQQIRDTTRSQTEELLPLLQQVNESPTGEFIWPLTSQQQIRGKAEEMIRQARSSILISCWQQELDWLSTDLKDAESRGLQIALVHFGEPLQTIGATYHHPIEQTLYEEKGGRGLTLVVDSNMVLIANYKSNGNIDAAWSRNQAFVTVADDYVKHDVYITKVTRFLKQQMQARFGDQYEKLRDVFNADI
jgi:sugar-specific transcriptional regulator TrmB